MNRQSTIRTGAPSADLRRPGRVLLISCYELGHQPLALASPLAFLERAGFAPDAMDVAVEPFDAEKAARARFVGISVPMHTALRLGARVAERVRAVNPGCHVCFYGLYATLNAGYLLAHGADSVIGGEFEGPLVALVEARASGGAVDVAGVTCRAGIGVGRTPGAGEQTAAPFLSRLPFPVPSRQALPPLEKYARLEMDGELRLAGYVEASRGCKHMCRHCPIPPVYGGRFFVIPQDVVLADIRRQVAAGARHITFGDPDFLNGPGHALRVARALHAEYPELTFDFTAKVEHVLKHRAILPELGALGCAFMVSAVESLSDRVLAILDKGHTRADVSAALQVLRGAGIAMRPSLVAFTPWTTRDDYLDVLEFVAAEELIAHVDAVQYTIRLLIPPGSALLSHPEMAPHLGSLEQGTFSYRWTHPDPRMDGLHREVSRLVACATQDGEAVEVTFARVWDLARERLLTERNSAVPRGRETAIERRVAEAVAGTRARRPPRLTESWFC